MKQSPNIILVMCDDLGYGDVGFNGGTQIQTPCLDRLAGESIPFDRFYAGGPVCSPTRGTCLTGRHYIRYGVNHANRGRLPEQERTLVSLCKDQGYTTGHFGKWHLGTLTQSSDDGNRAGKDPREYSPPWRHGFDVCFSTESKVPTWDPGLTPDETKGDGPIWGTPGDAWKTRYWNHEGKLAQGDLSGCDSKVILDRAEPFIRSAVAEQQPFLSVIWFHAPHTPVVAGPEWRALYPDASEEEQHYYGCVSAMDAQMGRLDALLRELEIEENTLLWFCSDNGPEGGESLSINGRCQGTTGGLRGRKRSLYEGGVGVPAFLKWPAGFSHTDRVSTPCSTLDMLPTCAAAMGTSLPEDRPVDGVDILPLLHNPELPRKKPIPFRFLDSERKMFGAPTFAIIDNQWKFLTNLDPEGIHDQLFDLEQDRFEKNDVATDFPERGAEYRDFLETFLDSCRKSHSGHDYDEPVDMITPFQEERRWKTD